MGVGASITAFLGRRTLEHLTRSLVYLIVVCVAWGACSQNRVENEWLRFRPAGSPDREWAAVPPERVHELPLEVRSEAVRSLERQPARPIDVSELVRFRGITETEMGSWYLLRAVKASAGTGSFSVHTLDRRVTVKYQGLSGTTDSEKSALLVLLPFDPSDVYVEIGIAR